MRSLLLFFALSLAGCYAASLGPDPLGHFAARTDHLHRLEPLGERILHGAALSYGPLDPEERTRPLVYAVYYELHDLPYDWHLSLLTHLDQYAGYGLPQIDLGFNAAGQSYEAAIAEGQLDEAIERLCWGLQQLNRPALLRLGYAFNSSWRAYEATSYVEAWQRLAQTLRGRWGLDHVALVWTQKDDGGSDYLAYYPGDEYVDWWSIDVAAPQDLRRSRAFVDAAKERGYPVLVGVVTPVTTDLGRAEQAWPHWFIPFLRFLRHHSNIKAFTYIDWDWSQTERFVDPVLFARYRSELMNPIYLHAASPGELRWHLNLDP